MLYPAAGSHPVVDVRKLVLSVEDVWHDGGPRNATPLRRGSIAAILHNPYAGEYVAEIQPMMEALKPLGREMAQRLIAALGGPKAIEGYGKGALIGLDGELEHGALWHVPGGYGMRDLLEGLARDVFACPRTRLKCDRAVDQESASGARSTSRSTTASPPTCAATSTASRCASPTARAPTR